MSAARWLTAEEAGLIRAAAEHWLRLGEVEFNAGEAAASLLALAEVRPERCGREDLATLDRTILLEVPGENEAIPITIVRPGDEDLSRGCVSILSDLGLACIGQVVGSAIRVPHGVATFVGHAGTAGCVNPSGGTP
jgi:transcription elongation GreA/GreB family factor